jgi:hypothetical protein
VNQINISLAAYPGMRHEQAAQRAISSSRQGELVEACLGQIGVSHVQLVPQNFGSLDESLVDSLMAAFPEVQFRLHANVRVLPSHRLADLSNVDMHLDWFTKAAAISKRLRAPAYTAHSGTRENATLAGMLDNARRVADLFGCPVGVEGQYPDRGNTLLVSSWEEYREVFESGVPYALDLSHLNIVVHKSGRREDNLVQEMLSCERCIEVHVSANDGHGDTHQVCTSQPWWFPLLTSIHQKSTVFTEGNHLRQRNKK